MHSYSCVLYKDFVACLASVCHACDYCCSYVSSRQLRQGRECIVTHIMHLNGFSPLCLMCFQSTYIQETHVFVALCAMEWLLLQLLPSLIQTPLQIGWHILKSTQDTQLWSKSVFVYIHHRRVDINFLDFLHLNHEHCRSIGVKPGQQ